MTDKQTPTDAELKAMWQIHAADIGGIFYYARAVLAKWGQPAHAAEPVAWAFKYDDGTWHDPSTTEHSSGMRPLFAAPQPARGPLTDEWIRSRCIDSWIFDTAIQWVRMTEAAHGIKGDQHVS